jgi:outer membrane protein assembly factor BamB
VPGGPLGLDIADGTAWVVATDGGQLFEVDLATGTTTPSEVGPAGNWVKVLDEGRVVLSRYGPAPGRGTLEIISTEDGRATPIHQDPIDALDVDDHGIWAFVKGGTVLSVDLDGRVIGQTPVEITQNEHIDLVGTGDGTVVASSDSTPVRRVRGDPPAVDATIETGGGVPFTLDGGLVWGARPDELWAIDPASGAVTKRYPLTDVIEVLDLDVDRDDAWIAVRHPGRVGAIIRLDLATGTEIADIPAGLPAAVVIDGDRTWVTDYEANALLGFDR